MPRRYYLLIRIIIAGAFLYARVAASPAALHFHAHSPRFLMPPSLPLRSSAATFHYNDISFQDYATVATAIEFPATSFTTHTIISLDIADYAIITASRALMISCDAAPPLRQYHAYTHFRLPRPSSLELARATSIYRDRKARGWRVVI